MQDLWQAWGVTRGADGELCVFIDGGETACQAGPVGPLQVDGLIMGADKDCPGGCFVAGGLLDGVLDEVRVMSRPLSADELLHFPLSAWAVGDVVSQAAQ